MLKYKQISKFIFWYWEKVCGEKEQQKVIKINRRLCLSLQWLGKILVCSGILFEIGRIVLVKVGVFFRGRRKYACVGRQVRIDLGFLGITVQWVQSLSGKEEDDGRIGEVILCKVRLGILRNLDLRILFFFVCFTVFGLKFFLQEILKKYMLIQ